jgi:hypothetical protein
VLDLLVLAGTRMLIGDGTTTAAGKKKLCAASAGPPCEVA